MPLAGTRGQMPTLQSVGGVSDLPLHKRDSLLERETESACDAVEVSSPELPRRCTARLTRIRRHLEEVV